MQIQKSKTNYWNDLSFWYKNFDANSKEKRKVLATLENFFTFVIFLSKMMKIKFERFKNFRVSLILCRMLQPLQRLVLFACVIVVLLLCCFVLFAFVATKIFFVATKTVATSAITQNYTRIFLKRKFKSWYKNSLKVFQWIFVSTFKFLLQKNPCVVLCKFARLSKCSFFLGNFFNNALFF